MSVSVVSIVPLDDGGSLVRHPSSGRAVKWGTVATGEKTNLTLRALSDTRLDTYYILQCRDSRKTYPIDLVDFMHMTRLHHLVDGFEDRPTWTKGCYSGLIEYIKTETDSGPVYSIRAKDATLY